MKIKTITCHDVYNHGASLQAYALMKYLQIQGHDVEIIDYKPDYLSHHYKLDTVSNPKWDKPFFKQLYLLLKLPSRILSLKRKKQFDEFRNTYLKITTRSYRSNEELKQNQPEADLFIAGSDQIWNTLFPNGKDAAFYLDFVSDKKVVKASYAASFATSSIIQEYISFVKSKISLLDFVSIREDSGLDILEDLKIKNAKVVCDPVFLLTKDKWSQLASIEYKENYIIIYDFEDSSKIRNIAIEIATRLNCKIYSMSPYKVKYAHKNFINIGPIEFISLIRNAKYVISNSFHGSAFALIFEKQFCVVNRQEGINERMKSLLVRLNLSQYLVNGYESQLIENIDYGQTTSLIEKQKNQSQQYLEEVLNYTFHKISQ